MTLEQIKKLVASPTYDFLQDNEHLSGRMIL